MSERQSDKNSIAALVELFLAWPLPKSVCSDQCATNRDYQHPRSGTNLLTADEARQMFEQVVAPALEEAERRASEWHSLAIGYEKQLAARAPLPELGALSALEAKFRAQVIPGKVDQWTMGANTMAVWCANELKNIPQAGAMTGTSFEGLKRPSSLDQPYQEAADGSSRNAAEVPESTSDLRAAGASPLSALSARPARIPPSGKDSADATETMLPCPSCGETDVDATFAQGHDTVNAGCMVCGMTGPDSHSAKDAADRWNALPRTTVSTSGLNWEAKYKNDLHNLMELEDWLEKYHPDLLDKFESRSASGAR